MKKKYCKIKKKRTFTAAQVLFCSWVNKALKRVKSKETHSCTLRAKLQLVYSSAISFQKAFKLNHLIRIAKRSYYDRKFDSAKNDLKLTWKLLKEVINKRKSKSPLPSSFKAEGRSITDPTEIATRFCKYFTNIGPRLASAIPAVSPTFRLFISFRQQ